MLNLLFGQVGEGNSITVSAKTFPGTYTVIGKTFARDTDGHDHVFTFYIPKAKIQSENTLTMEAEGDPTVFNMSLRVLRGDSDGTMMKLVLADEVNDTGVVDWNGGTAADNLVAANFSWDKGSATIYVTSGTTPEAPVDGYTWTPALGDITKDTRYVGKKQ